MSVASLVMGEKEARRRRARGPAGLTCLVVGKGPELGERGGRLTQGET